MRANLKRHNRVYILSSKHTYRPMRARVVAQLFYKYICSSYQPKTAWNAHETLFCKMIGCLMPLETVPTKISKK